MIAAEPPPLESPPAKPEPVVSEQEHDHGAVPHFLPHWMQERWAVLTVAVAGLALAVGFFGEKFFGLPPSVALGWYFLAYLAGALRLLAWHEPAIVSRIGIPKTEGQE